MLLDKEILIDNNLPENLEGLDEQELAAYCMELYKFSAEQSLLENDPKQYARLLELQEDPILIPTLEIESTDREFDEDEVGEGRVLRVRYRPITAECDEQCGYYIYIADIYVTLQGMEDRLGVVDWFPEGMSRRNANYRPID